MARAASSCYVRRVFIMDDAEQFLPLYLRFVKGVLDSADLPLNVSRELLQADSEVEAMRGALTRRVLELLAQARQGRAPRSTRASGANSAPVLKEGLAEDHANRDKLLPLLRFAVHAQPGDEEESARSRTTWRACRPGRTRSTTWSARASPRRAATRPSRRCAREASRCCC